MRVIDHTALPRIGTEGRERVAVADRRLGVTGFELWVERLAPRIAASLHNPQGADQVIFVVCGQGQLVVGDRSRQFTGPCKLFAPAGRDCEIINTGDDLLQLLVASST